MSATATKLRDECDDLCRQLVRRRVMCERCLQARGTDTAHLIPRRFARTRCDLSNLALLCRPCHTDIDQYPEMKEAFAVDYLGHEAWDMLGLSAEFAAPVGEQFWRAIRDRLKAAL